MSALISTELLRWFNNEVRWQLRRWSGLPGKRTMKAQYWAAVEPVLAEHPGSFTQEQAEAALEPWLTSMAFSQGPLVDGWPLMPFPAMNVLESRLDMSSRVFEYGAGGSSVFFSSRVGELVSVEHDPVWFEATRSVMTERLSRPGFSWRGVLIEPQKLATPTELQPDDPLSYASTDEAFGGQSFNDYAALIDEYPNEYFDLILIDGRARPSCFMHAMHKVKFNGYIILDNAERTSYRYIEETAEQLGFEVEEIWGPGPYNPYCWRTIFLRRKREWFALNDLDKQLAQYLDFDKGIFVEAGANNGISQSNTHYLEVRRGWTGLLVEAVPALYEACRRNRRRSHVVWAALAPPSMVPGSVTMRFAGLMSVMKGGMKSKDEEDSHIKAGCDVQKITSYEAEVPCTTLSSILDECGLSQIDLLSLDIEGFEAQALRGLDFSRHRPEYILVEQRYPEDVETILSPYYEVVEKLSYHDVLYRRK